MHSFWLCKQKPPCGHITCATEGRGRAATFFSEKDSLDSCSHTVLSQHFKSGISLLRSTKMALCSPLTPWFLQDVQTAEWVVLAVACGRRNTDTSPPLSLMHPARCRWLLPGMLSAAVNPAHSKNRTHASSALGFVSSTVRQQGIWPSSAADLKLQQLPENN